MRGLLVTLWTLISVDRARSGKKGGGEDDYIRSRRVTSWGENGTWAFCPNNSLVIGMQLKSHRWSNQELYDNTALNGIRFFCKNPDTNERTTIASAEGPWGEWGQEMFCRGSKNARCFQLRSQMNRGRSETGALENDDTAANNLRLFCEGKNSIRGDGQMQGTWGQIQTCPQFKFICGIRTQVEAPQGNDADDDDTSLNNVDAKCCAKKGDKPMQMDGDRGGGGRFIGKYFWMLPVREYLAGVCWSLFPFQYGLKSNPGLCRIKQKRSCT